MKMFVFCSLLFMIALFDKGASGFSIASPQDAFNEGVKECKAMIAKEKNVYTGIAVTSLYLKERPDGPFHFGKEKGDYNNGFRQCLKTMATDSAYAECITRIENEAKSGKKSGAAAVYKYSKDHVGPNGPMELGDSAKYFKEGFSKCLNDEAKRAKMPSIVNFLKVGVGST